jgi:NAD(P)-dependent dehydrogenase (short-subunit alcohol dehydrogenase family)
VTAAPAGSAGRAESGTRTAVVTGGASGIGRAVVTELRGRGWAVASLDLQPAGDADHSVQVDVTDAAAVAEAVRDVEDRLGPLRTAVNVAGYYEMLPVADITEAKWQRMLRVHVGGTANLARATLPTMLRQGDGSFVAIASELAVGGGAEDAHYAAAKGAILGLVRSLAAEVAPQGVRVNAVAPGPTDTPLIGPDSPWRAPDYLSTLPLRRLVTPEEVALCVAFLVEEGTFCVGEVLNVNAGAVI